MQRVRRGSQGACRAAPGKSGLHARGEGERVLTWEPKPSRTFPRECQIAGKVTGSKTGFQIHQRFPASSVLAREGAGCGSVGDVPKEPVPGTGCLYWVHGMFPLRQPPGHCIKNRLVATVGQGEGGRIWENSSESQVPFPSKSNPVPCIQIYDETHSL